MTERTSKPAPGSGNPRPQGAAASRGDSARRRASHPLLGAFPLSVMTLAAFLVVFALMMARLTAGKDPALHVGTPSALVETTSAGGSLRTRASGAAAGTGGAVSVAPAAAGEGAGQTSPAIVTRTSGVAGTGVGRDD